MAPAPISWAKARSRIVDPGPDDDLDLSALLAAVEGEQVEAILVTHTHRDHVGGSNKLRSATGARVVGAAPFVALRRWLGRPRSSHAPWTIRLTKFSPTASDGGAPAIRSRPSRRPAIAPITCALHYRRRAMTIVRMNVAKFDGILSTPTFRQDSRQSCEKRRSEREGFPVRHNFPSAFISRPTRRAC